MTEDIMPVLPRARFQAAMMIAVVADVVQMLIFPLFVEGAGSPAEDALDLGVGAALISLLGWHWEFAPSFLGKLVPGWTWSPFGRWRWPMCTASRRRWVRWKSGRNSSSLFSCAGPLQVGGQSDWLGMRIWNFPDMIFSDGVEPLSW